MHKRPINERFTQKVLDGVKRTTIREHEWPVGVPIMLYRWAGKPYASKHVDVAVVKVSGFWPIVIERTKDDRMQYAYGMEHGRPLYELEGFADQEEMDAWFRPLVKPGHGMARALMRFELMRAEFAIFEKGDAGDE